MRLGLSHAKRSGRSPCGQLLTWHASHLFSGSWGLHTHGSTTHTVITALPDQLLSALQSHSRRPGDAAFEDALREALLVERGLAHPLEGAPAEEEAVWTP